ncbi:MAG: DUF3306 domain-containing protein [Gammaproteobacteria bacterium]|nr:DUF3306 domain-containing protein [Gammaproteobacteria bacterium]
MKQVDPVEGRASEEVMVDDESRLSRWSRRKLASGAVQSEQGTPDAAIDMAAEIDDLPPLADEDMPPLETLTEESDYTGFLSPKVSDELRKLALRKLFHGSQFNICDGLDDYDEDFTKFAKLGDVITAEMRQRAELEALKKLQQQAEAEAPVIEEMSAGDAQEGVDDSIIDKESSAFEEAASGEGESETEIKTET